MRGDWWVGGLVGVGPSELVSGLARGCGDVGGWVKGCGWVDVCV